MSDLLINIIPAERLEQLREYIRECRRRGLPDRLIRDQLVQAGWPVDPVDTALGPKEQPRPSPPELKLVADRLHLSYGKFSVTDISFELRNGDIMGFVGRSGSGKSTIIRTLVGLKKPDAGKIEAYAGGKQVAVKDLVGYSPQQNALYPYLTVGENIFTFGSLHGVPRKEIRERMGPLLKRLDLDAARDKLIVNLSGGMQKRADLAVALIHSPKMLVLDEPFAGLDTPIQRFIWKFLTDLASEGNIIILSSHMLEDMEKYCSQFGLIAKGRFHNTEQVLSLLGNIGGRSLEAVLEQIFEEDIKR